MKCSTKSQISFAAFGEAQKAIVNGFDVKEIVELCSTLGYDCEIDARITGSSGTEHRFDILARKGSEILVMNIVAFRSTLLDTIASDEESDEHVIRAAVQMRAISWDCRAYHQIILHLTSGLSREADGETKTEIARILRQMKIEYIRSSDIDGAIPEIKNMLCAKEALV